MQLQWYYLASVFLIFLIMLTFKSATQQSRYRFLLFLAFINAIAYIVNWWFFYIRGDSILTLLPLQLCNIAVFLIPLALITKKTILMDFVFYICGLGGLAAIIAVSTDYSDTYSMMTFSFYVFHFSVFLIPLLHSIWGFHELIPSVKSALRLSILVLVISGVLHLLNLFINSYYQIPANYFFTIRNLSAPINPAFALFAKWIPYDYFFLLFALPVLYLYMSIIYVIGKLMMVKKKLTAQKLS